MEKKITMKKIIITLIPVCLLALTFSCSDHSHDKNNGEHSGEHGHETTLMRIKRLSNSDTTKVDASIEQVVAFLKTVEVDSTYVGKKFLIPERESQITSFQCSNCHSKPLTDIQSKDERYKKSHWNIKLVHAGENVMNCQTCHVDNDMDQLHTLTKTKLRFNHSYKVCSQCHAQQFQDWKGGAHGKRLGGWAKPAVKQTCVGCHNPHKPAFEKRMPEALNTKVTELRRGDN